MNEDEFQVGECGRNDGYYPLSRREFLQSIGSGIIIFFSVGDFSVLQAQRRGSGERPDFNAYLRIGEDGTVTCFTGKVELGQGVATSLAQMLADELDVPLESVEGRAALIELAAEHLEVPKDQLDVKNGVVFDKTRRERKVTYAQLAKGKRIERHLEQKVPVKTVSELNVIGKPYNRIDALEKVTGKAQYAGDIRVAGMVYARVLRPPAHGATLKSLDTSAVDKVEGAQRKPWQKLTPTMTSRNRVSTIRVSSIILLIMLRTAE